MDGLVHVFLHVGLCSAAAQAKPDTTIAMHVRMAYVRGDPNLERTFTVRRSDGEEPVLEFDVPDGMQRLQISVPKYGCSADDFVNLLRERSRKLTETLFADSELRATPNLLMGGTAPSAFSYARPTFVLFDQSVTCGQPIEPPLTARIETQYEQGAYYLAMYGDPALAAHKPVFALRLRMPSGAMHYVHLPIPFPEFMRGWPGNVHMDVTEDMVDAIATEKTDTLLCPKIWSSSVH